MAMDIEMPKFVDSQTQILWWEADEFLISMIIFSCGMIFHQFILGSVAVLFVSPIISRMKNASLEGSAQHALCSTGLMPLNKEFSDALEKEFYL